MNTDDWFFEPSVNRLAISFLGPPTAWAIWSFGPRSSTRLLERKFDGNFQKLRISPSDRMIAGPGSR